MPGRTLFEVRDEFVDGRGTGYRARDEDIERLSPLGQEHINILVRDRLTSRSRALPERAQDVDAQRDAILLKINTLEARADSRDRAGTRRGTRNGVSAGDISADSGGDL